MKFSSSFSLLFASSLSLRSTSHYYSPLHPTSRSFSLLKSSSSSCPFSTNSTPFPPIESSNSTMASDSTPPVFNNRVREKIALQPGFHISDWMHLNRMTNNLTGQDRPTPFNVTREELAKHTTKFDMWTAYKGKVYNISPYLPYHPGGDKILFQAAGKDCTELFDKYHRWVNIDSMLSKCYIGPLVD